MNDREVLLDILNRLQSYLNGDAVKPMAKTLKIDKPDNVDLTKKINDTDKYMEILKKGSVLERVLLILYVAKECGGNEKFTTGEISKITKELRRNISISNISTSLGNDKNTKGNIKYTLKEGKKYYLSMKGEDFLKEKIKK